MQEPARALSCECHPPAFFPPSAPTLRAAGGLPPAPRAVADACSRGWCYLAQLDTAEALRGLVEEFVAPRGLSNGGSWRFPNAQVLDLQHSILSLLFQLSQSPTQCVHSASALKELRQYRALDRNHLGGADLGGSSADSDASSDSDSGAEAYDGEASEGSLSDWSDDGEDGSGSPLEPEVAGSRGEAPKAAHTPWRPKPDLSSSEVLSTRMAEQEMLSGSFGPSSEGGLALAACGLAASVERHYARTQAYDAPSQYSTTTEWVLVREVSMMLLGETGDAFQRIGPSAGGGDGEQESSAAQTFRMLPVQVVHLSPDALQRLIGPLIATANDLLRIRFICSQHCGLQPDGATCETVQAFASAVESVLDESLTWVIELERRMLLGDQLTHRATDGSLLRFARSARPLISTVSAVSRIIANALPLSWNLAGGGDSGSSIFEQTPLPSEMATSLLDVLFAATREGDGLGKNLRTAPPAIVAKRSLLIPLAYRLLLETIRPQLMMLGAWIQDGRLYDIHQEFFIRASEAGVDPRAAKFWTRAYNLRRIRTRSRSANDAASAAAGSSAAASDEACVPLLFKSVASHVLACGKSTIVCLEDGVTERSAVAETPRSSDDLYRTCVRDIILKLTDHLTGAKGAAAVAVGEFTSSMMWESCLSSTIRARCAEQTTRLATRLIVEHRFEAYLDVLRACFFMGDGHFTSEVCRYCYTKVDQAEPWDDHNVLESLFNDVLQQQRGDVLSVVVEVERKPAVVDADSARRPGIYALDELFVGFRTPWPISIIIDDECIDRCNRIMRLLLQVKRAKHTLDGLFVQQAMDKSGIVVARTTPSASHEALLFQAELMHFVNNVHYYLMNRVAYGGWAAFKAELHRATELDTMAQTYRSYLIGVHDQCLLSPKARYVMDAILKILDIVLEMGHQQAGSTAGNDQHVEALRNHFRRLHKLLQNVLSTVVSQGSDTSHFADLATRLDYNGCAARSSRCACARARACICFVRVLSVSRAAARFYAT